MAVVEGLSNIVDDVDDGWRYLAQNRILCHEFQEERSEEVFTELGDDDSCDVSRFD